MSPSDDDRNQPAGFDVKGFKCQFPILADPALHDFDGVDRASIAPYNTRRDIDALLAGLDTAQR